MYTVEGCLGNQFRTATSCLQTVQFVIEMCMGNRTDKFKFAVRTGYHALETG